jgi:hypothetical protein
MEPEKQCTCEAPAGAAHNPDCDLALWTPKEKLDPNVQRMAWLMFQEWFKFQIGTENSVMELMIDDADHVHKRCLQLARAVRDSEVEAGG